jgi:streptolysin S family bacteriocin protoxin
MFDRDHTHALDAWVLTTSTNVDASIAAYGSAAAPQCFVCSAVESGSRNAEAFGGAGNAQAGLNNVMRLHKASAVQASKGGRPIRMPRALAASMPARAR